MRERATAAVRNVAGKKRLVPVGWLLCLAPALAAKQQLWLNRAMVNWLRMISLVSIW